MSTLLAAAAAVVFLSGVGAGLLLARAWNTWRAGGRYGGQIDLTLVKPTRLDRDLVRRARAGAPW